jgi:hypothetical protein
MVVGRERQRPAAQQLVVGLQQLRRGLGGAEGIHALIYRIIDAHVEAAGARHELPHAGRSHLGIDGGIEGGFHMRQRGQLGRQAMGREGTRDMPFPGARALHARAEAVGLAHLETHALRGFAQARRRGIGPEGFAEALFVGIELVCTGSQALEHQHDLLALCVHGIAPRRGGDVGRKLQLAVDDGQIALVVQEAFAGTDLGVDADPEVHVFLQLGGERQVLAGRRGQGKQPEQQREGAAEAMTDGSSSLDHGSCEDDRVPAGWTRLYGKQHYVNRAPAHGPARRGRDEQMVQGKP